MKRIIIGIHGLGNKPSEKLLTRWWLSSIREGLAGIGSERLSIPFDMVYWSDILHSEPLNQEINDKINPLWDKEPYTPGSSGKMNNHSIQMKMLKFIENQLDRIFLDEDMSIHFKGVTDKIIHRYFSDLETYYGKNCVSLIDERCSAKEAIQNRLYQKLVAYRKYKVLLIAHSMGSIVAYDVLWDHNHEPLVHTLVTIGSPLGLPVIVGRIFAEQHSRSPYIVKPQVPENIKRKWVNMSDYRDKVALDHTLSDDYAQNSRGLLAEDVFVHNDYMIRGEANPHKAYGYLRTPEMAHIINDFLVSRKRDILYQAYWSVAKRFGSIIRSIAGYFHRDKN